MRHITIKCRHGNVYVHEGKEPNARREWVVTGQLEVGILGSFKPSQYAVAANLAMAVCQEMNIPLSQFVTVSGFNRRSVKRSSKQQNLF